MIPCVNQHYADYKEGLYIVITVAESVADKSKNVIYNYRNIDGMKILSMPIHDWRKIELEPITKDQYIGRKTMLIWKKSEMAWKLKKEKEAQKQNENQKEEKDDSRIKSIL